MFADLHLHSYFSDGTLSPREIAQEAVRHGIGLISITDHNTRTAYPESQAACREAGIRLIPGVEIDCTCGGFWLHILSYGARFDAPELNALLEDLLDVYELKTVDMLQRLSKTDKRIDLDEYCAFPRQRRNGGWRGLDYLRSKGYDTVYPGCMKLYSGIEWRRPLPDLEAVCSAVHRAGGRTVVAHPGDRLPKDPAAFAQALELLRSKGVEGAECYYPSHSPLITQICLDFCRKNGLLITAGSDSHGGFARLVDNVCYDMGSLLVDESQLNLEGLV